MIYDYALEPELVATWGDLDAYRFFFDKFGLGTPRVVSQYPRSWKDHVIAAASSAGEVEKIRVDELIQIIGENMIDRHTSPYEDGAGWLENAEREHACRPFDAIVATSNPKAHRDVLLGSALLPGSDARWDRPIRHPPVPRKSIPMAAAVAPMLKNSTVVHFIDPNFGPENLRHRRPAEAFFRMMVARRNGRPITAINIHTSEKSVVDFFFCECREQLPGIIPSGLEVTIRRWRQRSGGEKLHDRFILTDIGGVEFSVGLDDGRDGETTSIRLLSREEYLLRWNQYTGEPPAFELGKPDPFAVLGKRRR